MNRICERVKVRRRTPRVAQWLYVLLALALTMTATRVLAQVPDGGAPAGILTKPPTLLREVEAVFPPALVDAGVGGTVVLEIDIGDDGRVMDARVIESAGVAFDEAALDALRQFEFSPAEVDGAPVAVRVQYSYQFVFRPPPEALAPDGGVVRAGPVINFSGELLERGTRRELAGATVVLQLPDEARETTSGYDGRFSFEDVPEGSWPVSVVSADHARYDVTETVTAGKRTEVTYFVRRKQYSGYETVVRGKAERKEVAQVSLTQEEIRLVPGSQGDALRVVQNLPGVARAPFSIGVLVVRGSKPFDTRTYVDDVFIPLLFHFGGLYATFNSNLIGDISFQPGNFGADYGRNIGGVVRASTRELERERGGYHGYVDVSLLDASALVETKLDDGWSVSVSGRRSYVDLTLPLALSIFVPRAEQALSFTVAPRYYDYQLRAEYKPPKGRSRTSITLFGSDDRISFVLPNPAFDPEGRNAFDTLLLYNRLALNDSRAFGENLRSESLLSIGFDRYDFGGGEDLYFRSTMVPIQARQVLRWALPEQRLELAFGLDLFALPYQLEVQSPPRFRLYRIPDPFISRQLIREDSFNWLVEPAAFVEAVWRPHERLRIVPGVRVDREATLAETWVDPRLAVFWTPREGTNVKGAVGLYRQPPDYRQGLLSPTFGNPDLLAEGAVHYAVGVEQTITDAINVDVQGYYKTLFDQAQPQLAPAAGSEAEPTLRYASTGLGRSYGVEVLLRHNLTKNFFGWIAYSLSRSQRRYAGQQDFGLFPLDQPHNLIALGSYKLPLDFVLGVRLRYASGPLNTPYVGAIYDANANYYFPLPGALFSRRLPAFFQADVRLDKRFVFDSWMLSVYADVQNVTNRQNVEGVTYNFDYTREQFVYGLPILPALGVRAEF